MILLLQTYIRILYFNIIEIAAVRTLTVIEMTTISEERSIVLVITKRSMMKVQQLGALSLPMTSLTAEFLMLTTTRARENLTTCCY